MVDACDIPVQSLLAAARRPDVIAAMDEFYADLGRRIAARTPVCTNKGECCRFAEFGHRLYVTALEVVYYLSKCDGRAAPEGTQEVCPHAHEGKCHARDRRPLGCRVFYCDPAAQHWQGPMTEEMLGQLRQMHHTLGVPYFYADWLTVLRALRQVTP